MTLASAVAPVPGVLTVAEGQCMAVLDHLLGIPRQTVRDNVVLPGLRPELLEAGAQRIAATLVRWLLEEGGHRTRQVLRAGRRVLGRGWDPALGQGFHLGCTAATTDLWLGAARHLPGLSRTRMESAVAGPESVRKNRRTLRDMVQTEETSTGDWVFYAVVLASIGRFQLGVDDQKTLVRRLRVGSPLATLLAPETDEPDALRSRLQPLAATPAARLVECAEDRIARVWQQYARAAWEGTDGAALTGTRWRALGSTQRAWLDVADGARRLDLARPVAQAVRDLVTMTLGGDGDEVRARLARWGGVRTVAERDELLAAVAVAVEPGTLLLQWRDRLATERYGDDRYEEAQVFVRDVDAILGPCRRQVLGMGRALTGQIG